ncbi:hypothetical protein FRC07_015010 [Ceratobasidium sp. 392]|nr:hypothetical protein FRC07_015010 [Ceratobasidium sp. 392]
MHSFDITILIKSNQYYWAHEISLNPLIGSAPDGHQESPTTQAKKDTPTVEVDAAAAPLLDDTDDKMEGVEFGSKSKFLTSTRAPAPPNVPVSAEGFAAKQASPESQAEEYVDVEADVTSGTETEEAEVERERELVGLDEWELNFCFT